MNMIGDNIKNIRQQKKLSQEELAAKVFTTRQTISNYETGRSAPDLEMISALAEALEVDSSLLLYGDRKIEKKRKAWMLWIAALILLFLVLIFKTVTGNLYYYADAGTVHKKQMLTLFWGAVPICLVLFFLGWSTAGVVLCYIPPEKRLFRRNRKIVILTIAATGLFAVLALLTVLTATGDAKIWPTYGVPGRIFFSLVNVIAYRFWPKLLFVLLGAVGCAAGQEE